MAREEVDALFVEREGRLQGVLSDIALLRRLLPRYLIEDPPLAQVLEEDVTDTLWQRLKNHQVGELLVADAPEAPQVDADATPMHVAVLMASAHAPLVAVRDGGRLIGGITSSALITHLLRRA